MNIFRSTTGSVLSITLIGLIIFFVLGIFLVEISQITGVISLDHGHNLNSFYAAEAGIAYSLFLLKNNWEYFDDKEFGHNLDINGDSKLTCKYTVEDLSSKKKRISSIGNYFETQTSLTADIERTFFLNDFVKLEDALNYSMLSREINFDTEVLTILGKIYAEEQFSVPEDAIYLDDQLLEGYSNEVPDFNNAYLLNDLVFADDTFMAGEIQVEVVEGDYLLDDIPCNHYALIVRSNESSPGNVIISEGLLSEYQDNLIMILTEGSILVEKNNTHSKNGEGVLVLYSESRESGIILNGDNIQIKGSLLAPFGTIEGSFRDQTITNLGNDYSVFYDLEIFQFTYLVRRK